MGAAGRWGGVGARGVAARVSGRDGREAVVVELEDGCFCYVKERPPLGTLQWMVMVGGGEAVGAPRSACGCSKR